jgi:RNA polymerase sigma factor (TIGR02999 family)
VSEITRILSAIEHGDALAAEKLLPLVYNELRRHAGEQMARERPGQTLSPTALVHEAYLRLVGPDGAAHFANRRYFFAAAAEAMRRILVENARRKNRLRHGGERHRVELTQDLPAAAKPADDVLAVDDALNQLAVEDPSAAELVKLIYFAGLTVAQAAETLGISERTAFRNWSYARAWLYRYLSSGEPGA